MAELAQVLRHLTPVDDPKALVDASTGDDAAVYLLDDGRALVVTLDFFTPVVDDPYDFGRIAAANALSDVYAMGARPLFALNLLGFPRDLLSEGLAEEIIRGGAEVTREAGIPVLGGHSVDDPEPKFGMVVVGEVDADAVITNAHAQPGDALVLTKPLGTGVITTALKVGKAPEDLVERAVRNMTWLNRGAAEVMIRAGIRAATDVTGFGLLGHLRNLLRGSGTSAEVEVATVPLLDGVIALIAAGHVPGGTKRNLDDLGADVDFGSTSDEQRLALADAQTSGGLLMAVPPEKLDGLLQELEGQAPVASVIGRITQGPPGQIRLL